MPLRPKHNRLLRRQRGSVTTWKTCGHSSACASKAARSYSGYHESTNSKNLLMWLRPAYTELASARSSHRGLKAHRTSERFPCSEHIGRRSHRGRSTVGHWASRSSRANNRSALQDFEPSSSQLSEKSRHLRGSDWSSKDVDSAPTPALACSTLLSRPSAPRVRSPRCSRTTMPPSESRRSSATDPTASPGIVEEMKP